jgi:hypothetical protein
MWHFPGLQSLSIRELSTLHSPTFSRAALLGVAVSTVFVLSGCDQVPSFDSSDKAANTAACESIAQTWETANAALSSGDLLQLPTAFAAMPSHVDQALALARDKPLAAALTSLKAHAESVVSGNQPDLPGVMSAAVGISARCAVLGAAVNLEIPQLP